MVVAHPRTGGSCDPAAGHTNASTSNGGQMTRQEKPAPKPAVEPTEPAPDTGTTERARRREAALRRLERTSLSKRTAAVLGLGSAAAVAAIAVAGTMWAPVPPAMDTAA